MYVLLRHLRKPLWLHALGMVLALLILAGLQWSLWWGEHSWRYVQERRDLVEQQLRENAGLLARNRALEAEVEDLRTGSEAVEERARRDFGMIRQDEMFFFLIGPEASASRSGGTGHVR